MLLHCFHGYFSTPNFFENILMMFVYWGGVGFNSTCRKHFLFVFHIVWIRIRPYSIGKLFLMVEKYNLLIYLRNYVVWLHSAWYSLSQYSISWILGTLIFLFLYSVAACDDTSFFFAGCLQDALKEKDHDCIIRLMAGRAEVR